MRHDLIVVGAGPVGMALALALRDSGLDVRLLDARARGAARDDPRVLALSHGTRLTLQRLGIWGALPATPIRGIHVSQLGGFGRTMLSAAEHDLPALGYVVAAGRLAGVLDDELRSAGLSLTENARVVNIAPGADDVIVSLDSTSTPLRARLVVCAEGGMREGDSAVDRRDYGQHAVITLATPDRDHGGIAYERFTPDGPLALLPFGDRYAIVHTAPPAQADRLLALDESEYRGEVERRMGGRLRLRAVDPRIRFPLGLRFRREPIGERTVWLGNAAQTLHPVAGQGFNLALRDVWSLAQCLLDAGTDAGTDAGAPALLARYARARRLDRRATIGVTDALVRLFSNDIPPLRHLRGAALLALDTCAPLRGMLARRMMFGARAWP